MPRSILLNDAQRSSMERAIQIHVRPGATNVEVTDVVDQSPQMPGVYRVFFTYINANDRETQSSDYVKCTILDDSITDVCVDW